MHGRFKRRRGAGDRTSDGIARAVPLPDLRQAVAYVHRLPIRAGRHIAVDEGLGQVAWCGPELANKLTGETAFLCLGQCTGVVRNQSAQQRLSTFNAAEVPGAVQGMESSVVQIRCVSDVMEPRGRLDQLGIVSEEIT